MQVSSIHSMLATCPGRFRELRRLHAGKTVTTDLGTDLGTATPKMGLGCPPAGSADLARSADLAVAPFALSFGRGLAIRAWSRPLIFFRLVFGFTSDLGLASLQASASIWNWAHSDRFLLFLYVNSCIQIILPVQVELRYL